MNKRARRRRAGAQKAGVNRPDKNDYAPVAYLEVRSRLLASYDANEETSAEWLVQVGRYVQDCWLREERARGDGEFNEQAHWDEWDRCDEATLRQLRSEALVTLQNHTKVQHRARAEAVWELCKQKFRVPHWIEWHFGELYRGFLGGVGIVVFGLLVALMAPHIVKTLRGAIDDLLPAETKPDTRATDQARTDGKVVVDGKKAGR